MVTSRIINQIYCKCLLRNREVCEDIIRIKGMTGGVHSFSAERLQKEFNRIVRAVCALPERMRCSHNPDGEAWIMARTGNGPLGGMSLLTTERLLVMAMALGMVRIVSHPDIPCDVPFVVIDDRKMHRIEMTKPRNQRNWRLVRWRKFPENRHIH